VLYLLVALILIALTVAPCPSVRTDCPVAARFAEGTARSGRSEDRGCAGGGAAPAAGLAAAGL